jgi:two-component system response regulator NreC
MIRVVIADDHAVVRSGLRLLLEQEEDLEPVGEAGDGKAAAALVARVNPDIALLDVVMPGGGGIEAAAEIQRQSPETRVVMLSMQDDPSYVREAFAAGASGYVLKDAADTELVEAIRRVAAGERYVHPSLGARLVAEPTRAVEPVDSLSDREREVLRLLALGYTNQEIAGQLFVSVRTVEAHRSHILTKLRVSTRAELVRHAIDTGLLAE